MREEAKDVLRNRLEILAGDRQRLLHQQRSAIDDQISARTEGQRIQARLRYLRIAQSVDVIDRAERRLRRGETR